MHIIHIALPYKWPVLFLFFFFILYSYLNCTCLCANKYYIYIYMYLRAQSGFAPSQWETVLLCNDVSHWLGVSLKSALYQVCYVSRFRPSSFYYIFRSELISLCPFVTPQDVKPIDIITDIYYGDFYNWFLAEYRVHLSDKLFVSIIVFFKTKWVRITEQ